MDVELAELEGALLSKLQATEQELALYKRREQREAQTKRQKTMDSWLAPKSRGLPTRVVRTMMQSSRTPQDIRRRSCGAHSSEGRNLALTGRALGADILTCAIQAPRRQPHAAESQ